jgi:hypothetical protein
LLKRELAGFHAGLTALDKKGIKTSL